MNKQKEKSDPLTSIATMVWYGIGMAFIALLLGAPYFLFWASLPVAIQLWLDPWWFFIIIVIIANLFTLLIKKLMGRK